MIQTTLMMIMQMLTWMTMKMLAGAGAVTSRMITWAKRMTMTPAGKSGDQLQRPLKPLSQEDQRCLNNNIINMHRHWSTDSRKEMIMSSAMCLKHSNSCLGPHNPKYLPTPHPMSWNYPISHL